MVETPAIELCFWYVGHRGNWGFCQSESAARRWNAPLVGAAV